MQTIQTTHQAISFNVDSAAENRIVARVVLQRWGGRKGNDAIFDCEKQVDVTDAILLLDHDFVIGLEDSADQTDEIGHAHVNHSGPLEVYVTNSIRDFFGVESLEDITLEAFEMARRAINPKPPEFVRSIVEMEVTATVLPGGDKNTAFDNLSIDVASSSENVIITRVHRMTPAAERAVVARAPDPALPRFMQLLALANAVSLDDGPILTDWTTESWVGESTNEVVRFAWTDGDHDFSAVLTEEGIDTCTFDDNGRFYVQDQEGDLVVVKFYKLEPIGVSNLHSMH